VEDGMMFVSTTHPTKEKIMNRMHRLGLFRGALSGLVPVLATIACVAAALPATAQTALTIGTAKDPNLAAQIVVARDKGYFKEAGLDVNVSYFPSGGDLMAAIVGGSAAIGAAGSTPVTTLRARPYPIRIVSQISDISGAQQIIVKTAVKTPEDLQGKKIAIMRGTSSETLFDSFAQTYGLDPAKVTLVNMAPAEMLASFSRGDVEAISVWEPNATRARKFGGKMLVSGTKSAIPGKTGDRRIVGDHSVLFATETFIRDQPNQVKAVLTALARADDFIRANKTEATAILSKEFGFDTADMTDIMAANRYTLELDEQLVNDLDALAGFLIARKNIQSKPEARTWIDPAPLRSVKPELVKLK